VSPWCMTAPVWKSPMSLSLGAISSSVGQKSPI
jgi:hypothetical protein